MFIFFYFCFRIYAFESNFIKKIITKIRRNIGLFIVKTDLNYPPSRRAWKNLELVLCMNTGHVLKEPSLMHLRKRRPSQVQKLWTYGRGQEEL